MGSIPIASSMEKKQEPILVRAGQLHQLKIPTLDQNRQLESVTFMLSNQPAIRKLNDVIEEQNKPAAFVKGGVEYHAERVAKLQERITTVQANEDELRAALAQELEPVTAAQNEIKTEISVLQHDIRNAETEHDENNEMIARRLTEIEYLRAEIEERREFANELLTVTIPAFENEKKKSEARMAGALKLEETTGKRWKNRIKNCERERSKLELRLARLNLRRPK